ncbi:formate/nitrite transporter family protein [Halobacterium yunchengense]|uniref:formate/nitrite transporter family protein n=1 Tax=Halobacterium yunchengense TaxID=3108497 RepID=UPI00300A9531
MGDATDATGADGQTPSTGILASQLQEGVNELERPADGLALSGLSAGLDIGFGPLLMAVVATLAAGVWGEPTLELALANAYAVGFLFVVIGRSELFTEHTTLAVLPVLDGRASVRSLLRLWGVVFGANVAGAAAFAGIAVVVAPAYGIADAAAFEAVATPLVAHDSSVLFAGAVLAGWLMGLLSWLVAAAQETVSRALFVWLVAATIGFTHLPHCVAGSVEVLMGVFTGVVEPSAYARFLVWSTAGNVLGGVVFVSLLKYGHVVRGGD